MRELNRLHQPTWWTPIKWTSSVLCLFSNNKKNSYWSYNPDWFFQISTIHLISRSLVYYLTLHKHTFQVYNLCIEEDYDTSHFHGRVEKFPFDDNHVPPLHFIKDFCESVHSWISSNPNNIAVVHCMVSCLCIKCSFSIIGVWRALADPMRVVDSLITGKGTWQSTSTQETSIYPVKRILVASNEPWSQIQPPPPTGHTCPWLWT